MKFFILLIILFLSSCAAEEKTHYFPRQKYSLTPGEFEAILEFQKQNPTGATIIGPDGTIDNIGGNPNAH